MWTLIDVTECILEEYMHKKQMRERQPMWRGLLSDEVQRVVLSFAVSVIARKMFGD